MTSRFSPPLSSSFVFQHPCHPSEQVSTAGETPLGIARRTGHLEIVRVLLRALATGLDKGGAYKSNSGTNVGNDQSDNNSNDPSLHNFTVPSVSANPNVGSTPNDRTIDASSVGLGTSTFPAGPSISPTGTSSHVPSTSTQRGGTSTHQHHRHLTSTSDLSVSTTLWSISSPLQVTVSPSARTLTSTSSESRYGIHNCHGITVSLPFLTRYYFNGEAFCTPWTLVEL